METRSTRRRGVGGGGGTAGAGEIGGATAAVGHPPDEEGPRPPEDGDNDADAAPSELLAPLLEEWRDVLVKHVLEQLEPKDCAMLAQVGKPWLAVVVANNLLRAGRMGAVRLKLEDFVGSVARLAWAKANGCPWHAGTCALAARHGVLEVLQWARQHGCKWDRRTCSNAALGGHLDVLRWARERGCEWGTETCSSPLMVDTWMCCGGRGSTIAHGSRRRVHRPLTAGTWRC